MPLLREECRWLQGSSKKRPENVAQDNAGMAWWFAGWGTSL